MAGDPVDRVFELYALRARKLLAAFSSAEYRRALKLGVGAAVEHHIPLRRFRFETVVDVGANQGQFSLVARRLWPDAKIIAFEPLPVPAATYKRLFASDPRVQLHELALGDRNESSAIHISSQIDSSSLLPITEAQTSFFPGTGEAEQGLVQQRCMDQVLACDDLTGNSLLKLDVQGFELRVLRGAAPMLSSFSAIYAECSFVELYAGQALAAEVIAWLDNQGFALRAIYNVSYAADGAAIQADFLFLRGG